MLLLLGKRPKCPEKSGHDWFVLLVCGQAEARPRHTGTAVT
ncbi:hypothetical protein KCH_53870 [Kitasatospora cheerisanensis KCTC 2395]|uniref:Uncharacterized protein n=1 Tax=Kitasatospora cheerisanensis KCTC 2395 TaxID=1348663 RepID=A0A066YMR7_9ACTN|nr:hypothetical protein KCH_53870 [Kitasatospora cheerisanensis KCTC 2395]